MPTRKPLLLFIILMALTACSLIEIDSARPEVMSTSTLPATIEPTVPHPITVTVPPVTQTPKKQSYRTQLTITFDGSWAGQPVQGAIETITEVGRTGQVRYLTQIDIISPTEQWQSGQYEFIQLEQQLYVKTPAMTDWFISPTDGATPADFGFFDGRPFVIPPTLALTAPNNESLSPTNTVRIEFAAPGITHANITFDEADGTVWLSAEARYIVQYQLSATMTVMIPDPNQHPIDRGRLMVQYQMTDIGADIKIEPPELSSTTLEESLPRLPEAQIVTTLPNFLEYTAPISPTDAAYFYRETLHELGWLETQAALFEEKAELHFSYRSDDETVEQTARVLITEVDGGLVKVVVYRQFQGD